MPVKLSLYQILLYQMLLYRVSAPDKRKYPPNICFSLLLFAGHDGSVGCASDWRSGGRGFDPHRLGPFFEIDHEIFLIMKYFLWSFCFHGEI